MEQKKKRIKFNLFDVIVIVLILVLAAAAYLILNGLPWADDSEDITTITYTLELTGLKEDMADSVAVGDDFYETSNGYAIGTVTGIDVVPYTIYATDEENAVIQSEEVSDYINLQITLEAEVVVTDDSLTTEEGQVIRTGVSITASNGSLLGSGYIIWTEREDAE